MVSETGYSRVIPSALMSCILQQAETIRIASLSTTSTRHSTFCLFAAAAAPAFREFEGAPLNRITSFMISAKGYSGNYWGGSIHSFVSQRESPPVTSGVIMEGGERRGGTGR